MGKGRAPCCDKIGLKKGPWTPSEDMRLMAYIQKYGHGNWRALPKQAGLLRCGKSCRLRWINYLRPDIKRGNFTPEEEENIIKLHGLLGNKWSKIASRLPGRTDNEIKNVWNTHLKKRLVSKPPSHPAEEIKETVSSSSSGSNSSNWNPVKQIMDGETKYHQPTNHELPPDVSETTMQIETKEPPVDLIEIATETNLDLWDILEDEPSHSLRSQDTDNTNMCDISSSAPFELQVLPSPASTNKSKPLLSSSSSSSLTSTSSSHGSLRADNHDHSETPEIPTTVLWDLLDDELGLLEPVHEIHFQETEITEEKKEVLETENWIADLENDLELLAEVDENQQSPAEGADHEPQFSYPFYDDTLEFDFDPIVAYFQKLPSSPTVFT